MSLTTTCQKAGSLQNQKIYTQYRSHEGIVGGMDRPGSLMIAWENRYGEEIVVYRALRISNVRNNALGG